MTKLLKSGEMDVNRSGERYRCFDEEHQLHVVRSFPYPLSYSYLLERVHTLYYLAALYLCVWASIILVPSHTRLPLLLLQISLENIRDNDWKMCKIIDLLCSLNVLILLRR